MTADEIDAAEARAYEADGYDTAYIHHGSEDVKALVAELRRLRDKGWNNCEDCIQGRTCHCWNDE